MGIIIFTILTILIYRFFGLELALPSGFFIFILLALFVSDFDIEMVDELTGNNYVYRQEILDGELKNALKNMPTHEIEHKKIMIDRVVLDVNGLRSPRYFEVQDNGDVVPKNFDNEFPNASSGDNIKVTEKYELEHGYLEVHTYGYVEERVPYILHAIPFPDSFPEPLPNDGFTRWSKFEFVLPVGSTQYLKIDR